MGTPIINLIEKRDVLAHVMLSAQIELLLSMLEDQTLPTATWDEHRDINAVMLATCPAPDGFLAL